MLQVGGRRALPVSRRTESNSRSDPWADDSLMGANPANAVDARSKANLKSVDDRIDTLSFRLSEHAVDPDGRSRYQLAYAAGIIGRLPPASLWQAFPREGPEETSPGCFWWFQASVLRRFLAVAACESQCHSL